MKPIDKCQNCHERDIELYEIEISGEKKFWCDSCITGYNLEKSGKTMRQDEPQREIKEEDEQYINSLDKT